MKLIRHDMEMTAALEGAFIAAPAQGVTVFDRTRLREYAARYLTILELGDAAGVTPVLELWGVYLINVKVLPVFYLNDYPGSRSRTELKDSDCIFPEDGICLFKRCCHYCMIPDSGGLYRSNFSTGAIGKRWM